MSKIVLTAHAKLNLTLDITGVAPNGYHTLDMVMHTVSLADTVTLEEADGLALDCPAWLPQGPGNLAWRAAETLRERAGVRRGARITLEKRIPAEAGLGGGSADAAAVLLGLNGLWNLGLGLGELCDIGIRLGSDVPFAVAGGTARVRGVGEAVEPLGGVRPLWFALAKPVGGVGTAEAYRAYDALGTRARPDTARFIAALMRGDTAGMAASGGNVLEPAAVTMLPAVGALLAAMRESGALYAAMTGSGSAVFGVFPDEKGASDALNGIDAPWKTVACSA